MLQVHALWRRSTAKCRAQHWFLDVDNDLMGHGEGTGSTRSHNIIPSKLLQKFDESTQK